MKLPVGRATLQDYLRKLFENDKLEDPRPAKEDGLVELDTVRNSWRHFGRRSEGRASRCRWRSSTSTSKRKTERRPFSGSGETSGCRLLAPWREADAAGRRALVDRARRRRHR